MAYLKDVINIFGPYKGPLLIKSCEKLVANNSSPYWNMTLQDVTGSINAKKWSIEGFDEELLIPGQVVEFSGTIIKYKNAPQFKVDSVAPVDPSTINYSDFYLACPESEEDIQKDVKGMLNEIEDEDLRTLVREVLNDNQKRYLTYPAAISIHHAYRGGIVYHSLSIAKCALALCERYPQLNKSYLIAGALLHDIGKIREMDGVLASSYTLEGNLLGHISIGAEIVMKKGEEIGTPSDKLTILTHMILSHHGEPEYGSAVVPQTQEALILHYLDDIDAKLNILDNAMKNVEVREFSSKLTYLNGKAFLKTK